MKRQFLTFILRWILNSFGLWVAVRIFGTGYSAGIFDSWAYFFGRERCTEADCYYFVAASDIDHAWILYYHCQWPDGMGFSEIGTWIANDILEFGIDGLSIEFGKLYSKQFA